MVDHLLKVFQGYAHSEQYQLTKEIFNPKVDNEEEIITHMFNKIKLIKKQKSLGTHMMNNMAFHFVFLSLPKPYTKFIMDCLKDRGNPLKV